MPPSELTPEARAALEQLLGPAPTKAVDAPSSATSTPDAPASAPESAVKVLHVVSNTTAAGTTRYGVVVAVDEPAIVGTNDDGTDKTAVHADVAWFGGDGVTTVAVDELTPIG